MQVGAGSRRIGDVGRREQRLIQEIRLSAVFELVHVGRVYGPVRVDRVREIAALIRSRLQARIRVGIPRLREYLVAEPGVKLRRLVLQVCFVQRAQFEARQRIVGVGRLNSAPVFFFRPQGGPAACEAAVLQSPRTDTRTSTSRRPKSNSERIASVQADCLVLRAWLRAFFVVNCGLFKRVKS